MSDVEKTIAAADDDRARRVKEIIEQARARGRAAYEQQLERQARAAGIRFAYLQEHRHVIIPARQRERANRLVAEAASIAKEMAAEGMTDEAAAVAEARDLLVRRLAEVTKKHRAAQNARRTEDSK